MAPSNTKINLKDKVEDGEIDLSMLDLQDVPVKEIANVKKAYSLDLSNNHISTLPWNFTTLTHLTKLDLSKNKLVELPESFGELYKLKYLDLYKNQLQHLPLSFSKLKALKWLDLKDNPLMPAILNIAGPCLETKQCQNCAKNIVAFYTKLDNKVQYEKSVIEEQQKALQENLEKTKQEKKKKPKKEKPVTPKDNSDKIMQSKASGANIANVTNKKSATKIKKTRRSSIYSYFKSIIVAFFLLSLLMFILTSAKLKCLTIVEEKVVEAWSLGVTKLPKEWQSVGIDVGKNIKLLHDWTGDGVEIVIDYMSRYNSVNVIVTEVSQVFKNVSSTASKIYLKVFGE